MSLETYSRTILTSLDNPANRVCQSRKISTKSYTEFVAQNSLCHAEKFRHLSLLFFISSNNSVMH